MENIVWNRCSISNNFPILKTEEKIDKTSFLKGKWIEVKNEYEFLWATIKNKNLNELTQEYKRIKDKETDVSKEEKYLPINKKLINKSYQEVLKSRGLKSKGRVLNDEQ